MLRPVDAVISMSLFRFNKKLYVIIIIIADNTEPTLTACVDTSFALIHLIHLLFQK